MWNMWIDVIELTELMNKFDIGLNLAWTCGQVYTSFSRAMLLLYLCGERVRLFLVRLKGEICVGCRGRSARGQSSVPWSYLEI